VVLVVYFRATRAQLSSDGSLPCLDIGDPLFQKPFGTWKRIGKNNSSPYKKLRVSTMARAMKFVWATAQACSLCNSFVA
jgi:hypothetical protein